MIVYQTKTLKSREWRLEKNGHNPGELLLLIQTTDPLSITTYQVQQVGLVCTTCHGESRNEKIRSSIAELWTTENLEEAEGIWNDNEEGIQAAYEKAVKEVNKPPEDEFMRMLRDLLGGEK